MFKFAVIFIILVYLTVVKGVLVQPKVTKENPSKRLIGNETLTTRHAVMGMINSSGKKGERTNSEKSGLPLVKLGKGEYYFGTYFKTNFFKAMQFCRDLGMDLLSIETFEENARIIDYISTHVGYINSFWTSGSDLGEQGRFVWLATGKPLTFTFWGPQEPNNVNKSEHCIHIGKRNNQYIWNDIPCTNAYEVICEVRKCTDFCIN